MSASYRVIEGSERRLPADARLIGPTAPREEIAVTVFLGQRPDGQPLPGFSYYAETPPAQRPRFSEQEFAGLYGAADEDVRLVEDFALANGLSVVASRPARRTVVLSGSVAQMASAFDVELRRYQRRVKPRRFGPARTEEFRGREGVVSVPANLIGVVLGVFGLDNRRITQSAAMADPPNTAMITIPTVRTLYDFPPVSASGQTIAILSAGGYQLPDIEHYFGTLPSDYPMPKITDITVDAGNHGDEDLETTQDICIAATAAPHAEIAVYFTSGCAQGFLDVLMRVACPEVGDPACGVLSSSYTITNGDDYEFLLEVGVSPMLVNAVDTALQILAARGVTMCNSSGDHGTSGGDGKAHVTFPASDPYVLAVGGTTIGDINGAAFDEYVWNDTYDIGGISASGATGGGVSARFDLPNYQQRSGYLGKPGQLETFVPKSVNDGHYGRGVPDVAANASPNSGYPLNLANPASVGLQNPVPMSGTSASAPLWAGLIAVLNAALGTSLGFINPILYRIAPAGFREIVGPPGPADNSVEGAPGYPATTGWNACCGWGSPNGVALLQEITTYLDRLELQRECATIIPSLEEVLKNGGPKLLTGEVEALNAEIRQCAAAGHFTATQVTQAQGLLDQVEKNQKAGAADPPNPKPHEPM